METYKLHYKSSTVIEATSEQLFAILDDHTRLSSHMGKSSWMMGGGYMRTSLDEGRGQRIGSRIRMTGKAFGISLFLNETVIRRQPPRMKVWETVGPLKLLVIGSYRMGFEIQLQGNRSCLTVFIDYNLPKDHPVLGWLFGRMYARWCVEQMLTDARRAFFGINN